MLFSKSFGYALRSILYIAIRENEQKRVQVDEISEQLFIPKHFTSKILKKLAKHQLLVSTKGPYGGFGLHKTTLDTNLLTILKVIDGLEMFHTCTLRFTNCNSANPCPLHYKLENQRGQLKEVLESTIVYELLQSDKHDFIKSIATDGNSLLIIND
jgi:Rrf2 family transcriptional regulator, iron-sulfur cluster assembly transcription factor